jgi:hypothetical protein
VDRKAQFEKGIALLGFEGPSRSSAGRPLCVILYWQAEGEVAADYTVFVHLIAADGFVQAQNDSQPVFGYHPTSNWEPGEIVADLHCLVVPPGITPGEYMLKIGLYDPENGSRLSVIDPPSSENALNVSSITIR